MDDAKLALPELEIDRVQSHRAYVDEDIGWPRRGGSHIRQSRAASVAVAIEDIGAHQVSRLGILRV